MTKPRAKTKPVAGRVKGASDRKAPAGEKARASSPKGSLGEVVARIERAMRRLRAPALVKNLSKGASRASVAALADEGVSVPSDLAELWHVHDGQEEELNGFLGSLDLLDHARAVEARADVLSFVAFCRAQRQTWRQAEVTEAEIRSDQWLPFGNRDSDWLVVSGVTGRVFTCGKDAPPLHLAAPSVRDWLERYAVDLEAGRYVLEEGFGDYYFQRMSEEALAQRAKRKVLDASLGKDTARLVRQLGNAGRVWTAPSPSDPDWVRIKVERPLDDHRAEMQRRALTQNARSLLFRWSVRGESLVADVELPRHLAADAPTAGLLEADLAAFASVASWRAERVAPTLRDALNQKGQCLELTPSHDHWRIEGRCPVLGDAFANTWQMRALVPIRAPASEDGLAVVGELNEDDDTPARVFVFEGQLGVAVGTALGARDRAAGFRAERAYWRLCAVHESLRARGRNAPTDGAALEAKLLERASACLTAMG